MITSSSVTRVRFDHHRSRRTGVAEAILAEGKSDPDLLLTIEAALSKQPNVLVTRAQDRIDLISSKFSIALKSSGTLILGEFDQRDLQPLVGIIGAGTSDTAVMDEIELTLLYHGIGSYRLQDVGVANIQRTLQAMEEISKTQVVILVLVAGQEGALFSVIPGMTSLPCIAVPSPVGYGEGGKGLAALYSALQSCSPGLVTVNIGNGFGAAAFCAKYLKSMK